jgi:hypothetical protein
MERFAELVEPNDIIEWCWVKDLTDHAWEIRRLRRFKVWFFEIQHDKAREFEAILSVGRVANKSPDEKKWAEVLIDQPDKYANIDKLIASAESRRNRTLREIERHRSDLARRLRQASEDAVDDKDDEPLKKAA